MSGDINYEAKTDRELLLLTVQKLNWMTANCEKYRENGECGNGLSKKAKASIWVTAIAAVVSLGLGVIELFKR